MNIHFHSLLLDGVYTVASPFAPAVFHPAPELEQQDVARLLHTIRTRILRLLHRRGLWPAPGEEDSPCESEPDSVLPFLTAASIQGRIALGPESGRRIERLIEEPDDADRFDRGAGALCANQDGFSLHAEVRVRAHDRVRLEHLCRYVARAPIAAERLSLSPDGKVVYELRRAWRDGSPSQRPTGALRSAFGGPGLTPPIPCSTHSRSSSAWPRCPPSWCTPGHLSCQSKEYCSRQPGPGGR